MSAPLGSAFRSPAVRLAPGRAPRLEVWTASLRQALRVMATRAELADLDERLLRDVGMTRREAVSEARRSPWDLRQQRG